MNIKIDGKICQAERGEFILDIARRNNIPIPTLCHSDALRGQANCRLCVVAVLENGEEKIVASCVYPVTKEIEVVTNSAKIVNIRKTIIMLLAARIPNNELLNKLKEEYSVPQPTRFKSDNNEQCLLCGLCVRACEKVGPAAISTVSRGITKKVSTPYDEPSKMCIGCGACAQVCPTGAIKIREAGQERTIWHKNFKLLSCEHCGKYFITPEELKYIKDKLGTATGELLCENCRKVSISQKLKDIYENAASGC